MKSLELLVRAQSGKTTLLKVINRTIEFVPESKIKGGMVKVDGENVMKTKNVYELRRKIGMVFPLPVGLPMSIYDNVAFAPRTAGMRNKSELDQLVERCLTQAALWDEVKDRLNNLGTKLSGGQQQRLTIARALSHQPEILCLDEFSIAVDPVTTMRIEDVLKELRSNMTIILVTNLVQQARRLANRTAFILNGDLIEIDTNEVIFLRVARKQNDARLREWEFRMNANRDYSITTDKLNLWYGDFQALINVSMNVVDGIITGLIGPSGCGKSTLLRCFNRINERYGYVTTTGEIKILGKNIYDPDVSLPELRKSVGMVFQRPNPLPISVRENVIFGLRVHSNRGAIKKSEADDIVEKALTEVFLWNDLKDKLKKKATSLQLEQQQKLCIARLLPLKPDLILMDEPCSALDAESTQAVEEMMLSLAGRYTMLIVTHNMAQARRVSKECIFMLLGEIVEHSRTEELFITPKNSKTADYIEGRYG